MGRQSFFPWGISQTRITKRTHTCTHTGSSKELAESWQHGFQHLPETLGELKSPALLPGTPGTVSSKKQENWKQGVRPDTNMFMRRLKCLERISFQPCSFKIVFCSSISGMGKVCYIQIVEVPQKYAKYANGGQAQ